LEAAGQGKAALATEQMQTATAQQQAQRAKQDEAKLKKLQAQAETLDGTELTIAVRVKEDSDIFGSVTARQVASALNKQTILSVKAQDVQLAKPLTTLGSHKVTVSLSPDVEINIQVNIEPDESQA